jgi:uncharacterized protein YecT (DUF1311 family)
MSRTLALTIFAIGLLAWSTAGSADPLLTKAQIAKAAGKIEACLAKQAAAANPKPVACVGLIKGPCDDTINAGGEAAHATCSDNETAAWDVLLNRSWATLAANMEPEKFTALKAVQKLWLSYRDAKCAYLAKDDESMMGYMAAADCRMDETARRALELRDLGG